VAAAMFAAPAARVPEGTAMPGGGGDRQPGSGRGRAGVRGVASQAQAQAQAQVQAQAGARVWVWLWVGWAWWCHLLASCCSAVLPCALHRGAALRRSLVVLPCGAAPRCLAGARPRLVAGARCAQVSAWRRCVARGHAVVGLVIPSRCVAGGRFTGGHGRLRVRVLVVWCRHGRGRGPTGPGPVLPGRVPPLALAGLA
jgi:hypothetical protein